MSANWPNPRNSVRIARTEFRRSLRAIVGKPIQLVAFALTALVFVGAPTVGGAYVALHFGRTLLELVPVLEGARVALTFLWFVPTLMVAQRAVGKTGRIDHADGMLTTVSPADVVGGLLLAEYARLLAVVSVPILSVAAALAYGLGAPAVFVTIVVTLFASFTTSLLTGHLLGVLFKNVLEGSELLTRYKSVLAVLAFLAYFLAVSSDGFGQLFARTLSFLGQFPMGWFGDLLVVGLPSVVPSTGRVVGAIGLLAVGVPLLLALDVRASSRLWYADRARPTVRQHAASGTNANARFLGGVASGPTRAVAASVWRRTTRGPIRLIYVAYPLLLLFAPLRNAITTGQVSETLPVLLAFYGTWAIGAAALNPLGDEGAMLPVTVLSTISGRQFVRGHVLAVTVVGLPVLLVVTAVTGFLSPLELRIWLALTAAGGVLSVTGPLVALALGTAFPRFGEVKVTRSRRVVVPSKTAFAYYTLVLGSGFFGAAVALVPRAASVLSNSLAFWSSLVGPTLEIAPTTFQFVGGVVALLLGVVAPPLAYRYAVRQFDAYTFQ